MSLINKMLRDRAKHGKGKPGDAADITPAKDNPERGRRIVVIVVILLFALGSLWALRSLFSGAEAPQVAQAPAPTPPPAAAPATQAPAPVVPAAAAPAPSATLGQVAVKAPAHKTTHRVAGARVAQGGRESTLLGAGAGTTSRGGVTLMFDHPVNWSLNNQAGGDRVELDVQGVQKMGGFPRNLPLPPGVTAIHAGITAPDTLNLGFEVQPGMQAYTAPGTGPASVLNVYFRRAGEETPAVAAAPAAAGEATEAPATAVAGGDAYTGALAALNAGEGAKAVVLLQQSLSENPDNADARETLAVLEARLGTGTQAEQLLADGLKRGGPGRARLAMVYATLLYDRGDTDSAIDLLKTNAPPMDSDPNYFALLAAFEDRSGKPQDTAKLYRELVQANPANGEWWMGLGIALDQSGTPDDARSAYAHALAAGHLSAESKRYVQDRLNALKH
jgi:Flp pilus assembly protein TadD